MFVNIMSDGKEFLADAKALTDADWAALNEQFPQFGAMYNCNFSIVYLHRMPLFSPQGQGHAVPDREPPRRL